MGKDTKSVHVDKRNLEYEPHLVSYIDILGFRELVATKSPNFISRAIRRVQEITAPDAQIQKVNKENYINLSDLIVHTVPILPRSNRQSPEGLVFLEINHLARAQVALIDEGFLIRGALIIGEIERTYGVLFGPGLISAYELEREQAQFPRIVVDSTARSGVGEFSRSRFFEVEGKSLHVVLIVVAVAANRHKLDGYV